MHFYKFHINDYAVQTRHLSNNEDLCYRRLLDLYYTEESQIPLDTHWVARRIQISHDDVEVVLKDFFTKTENGWKNGRADAEIAEYHAVCEKNKSNGKRGGRPKKAKRNPEKPTGNPEETQTKASRTLSLISNQQSENTPIVPTGDSELELVSDIEQPGSDSADSSDYSTDFETFWGAFPEKKGKGAAWRQFQKKGIPSVSVMVDAIHAQQLDRAEAKKRGEFYPEWKNPSTWLSGACWEDGLKYPQKKERAAAEAAPENWREVLVGLYPENFPDGMASGNFPSHWRFLEPSVQQEIRQASSEKEVA